MQWEQNKHLLKYKKTKAILKPKSLEKIINRLKKIHKCKPFVCQILFYAILKGRLFELSLNGSGTKKEKAKEELVIKDKKMSEREK